ncbi:MAG TPA: hypothetical protein VEI97_15535 [bacterium]|nr:hypothetical protein [bacterium]
MVHMTRRARGRISAASGAVWFVVFALLIVATLSYKGVGVIKYPASAAKWPVIGKWLNTPEDTGLVEITPGETEELSMEDDLQSRVVRLDSLLANKQQELSIAQADNDKLRADIATLQADIARLQGLVDMQKETQRSAVAKIYERMEPSSAVRILDGMLPERVAAILGGMKDTASAEILGLMEPTKAQLITGIMAGFSEPLPSAALTQPAASAGEPSIAAPVTGGTVVTPDGTADATGDGEVTEADRKPGG